jgi:hypothetical protein
VTDGPLTLPATLCLLAWEDGRAPGGGRLPHLVRAGALTELSRRGLLTDEDGVAVPADLDTETGDPVLDGLLELVRESRPHRWRGWVTLRARLTLDAVREQLTADGYLHAEKRRVLGVFPTVEHSLRRTAAARALRERTREALCGPVGVGELSERDAALAVLVDAAGLFAEPAPGERTGRLAEHGGRAVPALRAVADAVRSARATATAQGAGTPG